MAISLCMLLTCWPTFLVLSTTIFADYILQGSNPSKKTDTKYPDAKIIDWETFQKLLKDCHNNVSGDPSLDTANVPSTTAAMSDAESCVPLSLPLSDISNVKTVPASTSTKSSSAVHTSLKKKSTLYGKVFVLDGCFNNVNGRDEVEKLIKSHGGEVRTNLSVNVRESCASCCSLFLLPHDSLANLVQHIW